MRPGASLRGLIPLGSTRHANDIEASVWAVRSDRGLCVAGIISQQNDTLVVLSRGQGTRSRGNATHTSHWSICASPITRMCAKSVDDTRHQCLSSPESPSMGARTPESRCVTVVGECAAHRSACWIRCPGVLVRALGARRRCRTGMALAPSDAGRASSARGPRLRGW